MATTVRLPRRLAAAAYDTLLLAAVLFAATALCLPLTGGHAVAAGNPLFQAYLMWVAYGFFAWNWRRGQTLGMRAWGIRLQHRDGGRVSWAQTAVRFLASLVSWAALGAGFFWSLVDPQRLTWHDRWSNTRLVHLPSP